jgi:hypothetical protein
MSEKLLRFLLSELSIVRVRCKHKENDGRTCGFVSEVPIGRLATVPLQCPACSKEHKLNPPRIYVEGTESPFSLLQKAVELVGGAGDKFEVEFVLPGE